MEIDILITTIFYNLDLYLLKVIKWKRKKIRSSFQKGRENITYRSLTYKKMYLNNHNICFENSGEFEKDVDL